jgi:hemin uptake protein HemP
MIQRCTLTESSTENKTLDKKKRQSLLGKSSSQVTGPEIDTTDLFGNQKQISLIHQGESYKLRITPNNKLILTK